MLRSNEEKQQELNINLEKLNQELDDYSFNNHELSNEEKQEIITLYKIWKESLNNKIFIDNESGTHIRVKEGKIITIGNKNNGLNESLEKELFSGVNEKSTLYFANCDNVTIVISTKVAHITLDSCKNVNIKIIGGSVSGIDSIRCINVSHVFDNGDIYFIDISKSENCKFYFTEKVALSTIISTMYAYSMQFSMLSEGKVKNTFEENKNYFDISRQFIFQKSGDDILIKDVSYKIKQCRFSQVLPVFAKQLRTYFE